MLSQPWVLQLGLEWSSRDSNSRTALRPRLRMLSCAMDQALREFWCNEIRKKNNTINVACQNVHQPFSVVHQYHGPWSKSHRAPSRPQSGEKNNFWMSLTWARRKLWGSSVSAVDGARWRAVVRWGLCIDCRGWKRSLFCSASSLATNVPSRTRHTSSYSRGCTVWWPLVCNCCSTWAREGPYLLFLLCVRPDLLEALQVSGAGADYSMGITSAAIPQGRLNAKSLVLAKDSLRYLDSSAWTA